MLLEDKIAAVTVTLALLISPNLPLTSSWSSLTTSGLLAKLQNVKLKNLKLSCFIHISINGVIKGITVSEHGYKIANLPVTLCPLYLSHHLAMEIGCSFSPLEPLDECREAVEE